MPDTIMPISDQAKAPNVVGRTVYIELFSPHK